MNSCQGRSPPGTRCPGEQLCMPVCLSLPAPWPQAGASPGTLHSSFAGGGGKFQPLGKGAGVRVRPHTAPVPREELFPRKIPSPRVWGRVFGYESSCGRSAPPRVRVFQLLRTACVRTGAFPRLPRTYPATPPGGKAGAMLRSVGTRRASPPRGSPLRRAGVTGTDAPGGTGAPTGPSSPIIWPWGAQGWDQSHSRMMTDVTVLGQNPSLRWDRMAERLARELGSHPRIPGTCCAAPSALPAPRALTPLQPRRQQLGACVAPGDAWPGPQFGAGLYWEVKSIPGCKAGLACTRQGLNPTSPQGRGGTSHQRGRGAGADAGGDGEPPGTARQERLSPEIGLEPPWHRAPSSRADGMGQHIPVMPLSTGGSRKSFPLPSFQAPLASGGPESSPHDIQFPQRAGSPRDGRTRFPGAAAYPPGLRQPSASQFPPAAGRKFGKGEGGVLGFTFCSRRSCPEPL